MTYVLCFKCKPWFNDRQDLPLNLQALFVDCWVREHLHLPLLPHIISISLSNVFLSFFFVFCALYHFHNLDWRAISMYDKGIWTCAVIGFANSETTATASMNMWHLHQQCRTCVCVGRNDRCTVEQMSLHCTPTKKRFRGIVRLSTAIFVSWNYHYHKMNHKSCVVHMILPTSYIFTLIKWL